MAEEVGTVQGGAAGSGAEGKELIPGTGIKSVEDLVKAHTELQNLQGKQANELGTHRSRSTALEAQVQALTEAMKSMGESRQAAPAKQEPTVDYESQAGEIEKQIQELDPVSDGYNRQLASLTRKLATVSATAQHQKTLAAAQQVFQQELNNRDTSEMQQRFKDQHPDFDTPETQAEISAYLSKDRTQVHDRVSAYFANKAQKLADALAARDATFATEKSELEQRLKVAEGAAKSGHVLAKGQPAGSGQPAVKAEKVTGEARRQGMLDALRQATTS